jgi:hypothetical protein
MKKIVFTLITTTFIFCSSFGQTKDTIIWIDQTSNVFYVIPPTSGCNGIWAVDHTLFPGCSDPTVSFSTCWDHSAGFGTVQGDTLFIALCSIPCEIVAFCTGGSMAIIRTGTPNYVSVELNNNSNHDFYKILTGNYYSKTNDIIKVNVQNQSEICLTNTQGKIINCINGLGIIEINLHDLSSGLYFISIISEKLKHVEKIIKE